MSNLIACSSCDQPIAKSALKCPHCGAATDLKKAGHLAFWGTLIAVIFVFAAPGQPWAPAVALVGGWLGALLFILKSIKAAPANPD